MTGFRHFEIAEEILKAATLEKDSMWASVMVQTAQAHATLALASRNFAETSPRFEPGGTG